jgi:hypothetical protein
MFNRNTSKRNQTTTVDFRVEHKEIARVLLIGNSEVVIYRDKPGQLLFGLFNPAPRKPEN